jgi:predicted Na+-dependent transporter
MMEAAADASERFLLVLVLVVAAAGVAAPAPGRALAEGNGIDAALAVLVFATGLSLRLADLAAVRLAWRRIAVVLAVSTAALPVLAWAASLLIGDPVLRSGMQAAGVAPAEVATVALCVIAGGDAAVCATLLAASTIITVVAAGPILSLLGASVTVRYARPGRPARGSTPPSVSSPCWPCSCCCGRWPARSGWTPPTSR